MSSRLFLPFLVFISLVACISSATAQVQRSIAPNYVTKDTFFIMVIHPQKIISQVGKDHETVAFLQDQLKNNGSMDLSKMTQFALLLGGPDDSASQENFLAIVLQFTENVDAATIAGSMFSFAEYDEAELEGTKIFRPSQEGMPSVWNANGKTLVIGLEERLAGIISNATGMPAGTDLSRKVSADADLAFAVNLQDLSDVQKRTLRDMTSMWAPAGLNAEELGKVASSCVFSVHSSNNIPAKLEFQAKNAKSQEELKTKVENLWKQFGSSMESIESDFKEDLPEQMQATAKAITDAFKILKSEGNVVTNGDTVSIQIERMQGFKEAAVLIVEGVAAPFRFFSDF